MNSIVAWDPGVSTGVCRWNSGEIRDASTLQWEELVDTIHVYALSPIWIVESFNLLPQRSLHKTFSAFPEIEVIGFLRGIALTHGIRFELVSPGRYKPFARKIKVPAELGGARLDRHQKDAYRLLLYAQRFILK